MRFFNEKFEFDAAYLAIKEATQQYLDDHKAIVEEFQKDKKDFPFTINNIVENGFVIKTCGLFAFISFYHMPWHYPDNEYWKVVFPKIKGRYFFGEIYQYVKETTSIMLDGSVHQFKEMVLIEKVNYTGIILRKTELYMIIDIGYNFRWDCGSFIGILSKNKFNYCYYDDNYNVGNEIEVKYHGVKENGHVEFSKEKDIDFWNSDEAKSLIGTIVDTRVVKRCERNEYWVNNKYTAILPVNKEIYKILHSYVTIDISDLQDEDIIKCEVLSINTQYNSYVLKWQQNEYSDLELEDAINKLVNTAICVTVRKQGNIVSIKVYEKFDAVFPVTKQLYPCQNMKQIESELKSYQDGAQINCLVVGYDHLHSYFVLKLNRDITEKMKDNQNGKYHNNKKIKEPPIKNSIFNIIDEQTYAKLAALMYDDSDENIEDNAL